MTTWKVVLFGSHYSTVNGKWHRECLVCPLKTIFTTHILKCNFPMLVCRHRLAMMSISRIYSGIGEIWTL